MMCLLAAGAAMTTWMRRSMEQANQQVTTFTCYFLASALLEIAKVYVYMKSKPPLVAGLLATIPFFTSAVFKLCLISLADITIRFLATDTLIRDNAENLFELEIVELWKPVLRWWLDSRAFTLLKGWFHSTDLSGSQRPLSPKAIPGDLLRRCKEHCGQLLLYINRDYLLLIPGIVSNTSSRVVLPSYFTIIQPEMFIVFVPKLLQAGFGAALIFLWLSICITLALGEELNLAWQLGLCMCFAFVGRAVSCTNTHHLSFCKISLTSYSFLPLLHAY